MIILLTQRDFPLFHSNFSCKIVKKEKEGKALQKIDELETSKIQFEIIKPFKWHQLKNLKIDNKLPFKKFSFLIRCSWNLLKGSMEKMVAYLHI